MSVAGILIGGGIVYEDLRVRSQLPGVCEPRIRIFP